MKKSMVFAGYVALIIVTFWFVDLSWGIASEGYLAVVGDKIHVADSDMYILVVYSTVGDEYMKKIHVIVSPYHYAITNKGEQVKVRKIKHVFFKSAWKLSDPE